MINFAKANGLNNVAVIIGINEYSQSKRKFTTLNNAARDAVDLAFVLKKKYEYDTVHLLTDSKEVESSSGILVKEPTSEAISTFLTKELPAIVENDTNKKFITCLLFYFAGHGEVDRSDTAQKGYLIPQDAHDDGTNWLEMEAIFAALAQSGCQHILAILDSCYSGASVWAIQTLQTRQAKVIQPKFYKEHLAQYKDRNRKTQLVMYSANYNQEAFDGGGDSSKLGNSPFAGALINALKNNVTAFSSNARKGKSIITTSQLLVEIQEKLSKTQEPGLQAWKPELVGREFIFYNPRFDAEELENARPVNKQNNPYQGLQAFEQRHAVVFCGRDSLTKKLCDRLYQPVTIHLDALRSTILTSGESILAVEPIKKPVLPLTIVLGNSGSGKSSLVKAGVLPLLHQIQFAQSWNAAKTAEKRKEVFQNYFDNKKNILEILDIEAADANWLDEREFPAQVKHFLPSQSGAFKPRLNWQILDPMRPGDKPFMNLARAFLPIDRPDLLEDKNFQSLNQFFKDLLDQWRKQQSKNKGETTISEQIQYAQFWEKTYPEARLLIVRDYYDSEKDCFTLEAINDLNLPPSAKDFHTTVKNAIDQLTDRLESDSQQASPRALVEIINKWFASQTTNQPQILLVIDQLEELITLECPSKAKDRSTVNKTEKSVSDRFLNTIMSALRFHADRFRVIMTLRSDFEPRFFITPLKDWLPRSRFPVPPMSSDELRQAIELPAKAHALEFKPLGLVSQLIEELGQPGALPLLSFVLSELYLELAEKWKTDNKDRALVLNADNQRGGIAGFLSQRADTEYEKLRQDFGEEKGNHYQAMLRKVMLRMVALEEGGSAKRRVRESELIYPTEQDDQYREEVLKRLVDARLLVKGRDEGEPYYEPAHDYLLNSWTRLIEWISAERADLVLQRRLTPVAKEWIELKAKSKSQPSGVQAKGEQVIKSLDRVFSSGERLVTQVTLAQLARLQRRSQNQQEQLLLKPRSFLWNADPYLEVLDKKLKSDDNWFNQFEAEFVDQSVLQKTETFGGDGGLLAQCC